MLYLLGLSLILIVIRIKSLYNFKNNNSIQLNGLISQNNPIIDIIIVCIFAPIVEELFYRRIIYNHILDYFNNELLSNMIVAILFSISHTNHLIYTKISIRSMLIYLINISYLGFYIGHFHHNLYICILIHMIWNSVSLFFIYNKRKYNNYNNNDKQYFCINVLRRKRCKSLDNYQYRDKFTYITGYVDLPLDIKTSFDNFNENINNHTLNK